MADFHPRYDNADGDIVLSSSDGILFRVHSVILKLASGFFKQMLEIPRVASENAHDPLPLDEDGKTICLLLDGIYPRNDASELPSTYDEAWTLTRAADKYDIPCARQSIQSAIYEKPGLQTDPLRLYALACHWKCADATRRAAERAAKRDILSELCRETPAAKELSDKDALNLLRFRRKQIDAFVSAFEEEVLWNVQIVDPDIWHCPCSTTSYEFEDLHILISSVFIMIRGFLKDEKDISNIFSDDHFAWNGATSALQEYKCTECDVAVIDEAKLKTIMKGIFQGLDMRIPWDKVRAYFRMLAEHELNSYV
ncbi:hypothetical protein ACEPAH_3854 [Sanghuangporus vaninii]